MSRAPSAPGRLGEALDPRAVQEYLAELDTWVRDRRTELDELDQAALAAHRQAEVTGDMMLSMALWKAVSDRQLLLLATWDGGRVGERERERLSTLIWGRLDATLDRQLLGRGGDLATSAAQGLAVSLPEACRLSDALLGQLRVRLGMDPSSLASLGRVRELRASLERLRDQVSLEPATSRAAVEGRFTELASRVADVTERAQRGADVGGLLGPLEAELALAERDLIVGNAQRRDARDLLAATRELRADLVAREAALEKLAERCVAEVDPAPRYAVPDVDALGPVPNTPAALNDYRTRLDRVSAALTLAQREYARALTDRDELVALLDAYRAKAAARGVAGDTDLAAAERAARDVLARRPTPMPVARQLVEAYRSWLDWADSARGSATSKAPGSKEETA